MIETLMHGLRVDSSTVQHSFTLTCLHSVKNHLELRDLNDLNNLKK